MIPRACTCIDTLDASLCPVDGAPHVPIADIERRIADARDLCIRRLADWLSAQRGSDVTEAQDETLAHEVFAHGAMAPDFTAAREAGAKQRTVDIIRLLVDEGFIAEAELVRMTYAPSPDPYVSKLAGLACPGCGELSPAGIAHRCPSAPQSEPHRIPAPITPSWAMGPGEVANDLIAAPHSVRDNGDCVEWCNGCKWRRVRGLPLDWIPPEKDHGNRG